MDEVQKRTGWMAAGIVLGLFAVALGLFAVASAIRQLPQAKPAPTLPYTVTPKQQEALDRWWEARFREFPPREP